MEVDRVKSIVCAASAGASPLRLRKVSIRARTSSGAATTRGYNAVWIDQLRVSISAHAASKATASARRNSGLRRTGHSRDFGKHPLLPYGRTDHSNDQEDEDHNDRARQPRRSVSRDRNPQVPLGHVPEHETQHQAYDEESAEQDGHGRTAGHAEGDRRDERASLLGVDRGSRTQDAPYVSLSKPIALSWGFRALHRMCVGDPLGDAPSNARDDPDVCADQAAADGQPDMAERVEDALPHLTEKSHGRIRRDGRHPHGEIDDFRDREETDEDRNQIQAIPQVE